MGNENGMLQSDQVQFVESPLRQSHLRQSKLKSQVKQQSKIRYEVQPELTEAEKKQLQEERKRKSKGIIGKLLTYNKSETLWFVLACFFSAAFGCVNPMVAIPFAALIDIFPKFYYTDRGEWRDEVN